MLQAKVRTTVAAVALAAAFVGGSALRAQEARRPSRACPAG